MKNPTGQLDTVPDHSRLKANSSLTIPYSINNKTLLKKPKLKISPVKNKFNNIDILS